MTSDSPSIIALGIVGLAAVGLYGLIVHRNLIKIIISLQILGKAAILALVLAGYVNGKMQLAQSIAITAIVVDTIVSVVALALVVQIRRVCGTLDLNELARLKY